MSSDREGSMGSDAMDEEQDDEIYGNGNGMKQESVPRAGATTTQIGRESGEEEDEDDDDSEDSDLDIITESKEPVAPQDTARHGAQIKTEPSTQRSTSTSQAQQQSQPGASATKPAPIQTQTTHASIHAPTSLLLRDGRPYAEARTSTIEITDDPMYNGKPISELEVDADLAEHMKPWRAPGADQSDWFNYGFDEFTWAQYSLKQRSVRGELKELKDPGRMFEMLMGGGGAGGNQAQQQGSGTPSDPSQQQQQNPMAAMMSGMGMPNEDQMMSVMSNMMQANGVSDPSQLDFTAFMQQFGGGMPGMGGGGMGGQGGGNVPSGPAGWQGGGGGGGGAGGGGRGGKRRW